MLYCFADYELDTATVELRKAGAAVALEPQVYALLTLLIENRERMVSRDELVEKVWEGRVISEAAIASRIQAARRAVGDDGRAQRIIRTVHGRGVRFIAAAAVRAPAAARMDVAAPAPGGDAAAPGLRPSIAILPFHLIGDPEAASAVLADALPYELITALSRLRWLFVIARGSSFRFRGPEPDVGEVGRALQVRYCLCGSVEPEGGRLAINTELADTRDGGVVWAERYEVALEAVHEVRSQIVHSIVNALELQIPLNEARAARLVATENLDAWSAYHLGVQHMYRFNAADNARAARLFTQAIGRDPHFSRAHAGLSFAHFQNAFLRYTANPLEDARLARTTAERALEIDSADPFANFTLGRSYWLDGELETSLGWLDRAIVLCPNYAQGIYSRAWAQTVSGRGQQGRSNADAALALSPLDPFLYGMLGTRSLAHMVLGEYAAAAEYGERAARAPGAHVLIGMIAVAGNTLAGNSALGARWAENVRQRRGDLTARDFFRAFPFAEGAARQRITEALAAQGF